MRNNTRRPFPKALWILGLLLVALWALTATPQGEDEALEEDLKTFVPSEELPADSAISFPVDI